MSKKEYYVNVYPGMAFSMLGKADKSDIKFDVFGNRGESILFEMPGIMYKLNVKMKY